MTVGEYTIDEHMHRFAVWTAARAASRSRLKNSEIEYLIKASNLREEINNLKTNVDLSEPEYRNWLKKKGDEIVKLAHDKNWSDFKTKTFKFGLAAKIISIYIKTVEVLPTKGLSLLSRVAHPPIDGILLRSLSSTAVGKMKANWSTFEWPEYESTINRILVEYHSVPGWKMEHCWKVSDEENII